MSFCELKNYLVEKRIPNQFQQNTRKQQKMDIEIAIERRKFVMFYGFEKSMEDVNFDLHFSA